MKLLRKALLVTGIVILLGFLIPQNLQMPVRRATAKDYHPDSFWYYPWGKSVTHKGVDIFARKGTEVISGTPGLVLYSGKLDVGGHVVLVLGPKWRVHYYAHLDEVKPSFGFIKQGKLIGTVGDSGNAKGKQPHLHYSIMTLIPYPWRIDGQKQGFKKMFYLNPIDYLQSQ